MSRTPLNTLTAEELIAAARAAIQKVTDFDLRQRLTADANRIECRHRDSRRQTRNK